MYFPDESRRQDTKVGFVTIPDLTQKTTPIGIPYRSKLQAWRANQMQHVDWTEGDRQELEVEAVFSSAPHWLQSHA